MTMKDTINELDNSVKLLRKQLEQAQQSINELRRSNAELNARLDLLEVAAPAALRALNFDTVKAAVEADPYTRFEVLEDWRGQLRAGAIIRADHVPHLLDYVQAGLQLGIPQDQAQVIARYKAETEARARMAEQEAKLAEATTARIQTQAAEARALALGEPQHAGA